MAGAGRSRALGGVAVRRRPSGPDSDWRAPGAGRGCSVGLDKHWAGRPSPWASVFPFQLLEVAGVESRSWQVPEDLGVLGLPHHQRAHACRDAVQVRRGGLRRQRRCGRGQRPRRRPRTRLTLYPNPSIQCPHPGLQAPSQHFVQRCPWPEDPSPVLLNIGSSYRAQTPPPPRSLPALLPFLARTMAF